MLLVWILSEDVGPHGTLGRNNPRTTPVCSRRNADLSRIWSAEHGVEMPSTVAANWLRCVEGPRRRVKIPNFA
jgi:hypothetical protein